MRVSMLLTKHDGDKLKKKLFYKNMTRHFVNISERGLAWVKWKFRN